MQLDEKENKTHRQRERERRADKKVHRERTTNKKERTKPQSERGAKSFTCVNRCKRSKIARTCDSTDKREKERTRHNCWSQRVSEEGEELTTFDSFRHLLLFSLCAVCACVCVSFCVCVSAYKNSNLRTIFKWFFLFFFLKIVWFDFLSPLSFDFCFGFSLSWFLLLACFSLLFLVCFWHHDRRLVAICCYYSCCCQSTKTN